MTPALIRSARNVWITASSDRKRTALTTAAGLHDDPRWPVSFAGGTDSTIWMVDEAAMPSAAPHRAFCPMKSAICSAEP